MSEPATDPLVAAFEHAVYDIGNADQNGPTAADVLRCGRDMRAKRTRLSAVLAAARDVVRINAEDGIGPWGVVGALARALAAADGAA